MNASDLDFHINDSLFKVEHWSGMSLRAHFRELIVVSSLEQGAIVAQGEVVTHVLLRGSIHYFYRRDSSRQAIEEYFALAQTLYNSRCYLSSEHVLIQIFSGVSRILNVDNNFIRFFKVGENIAQDWPLSRK
ncbi:MAG: hypothetical protein NZ750_00425 [Anaerolineae bacterium]|nr:hypothetical protein [Anaerolineae bacterium]MDW8173050.1 hypothetical protein [Anaerolineae bacterium]